MKESRFYLARMDCPSEERLIRDRFRSQAEVERLEFDLMQQQLKVVHGFPDEAPLLSALARASPWRRSRARRCSRVR